MALSQSGVEVSPNDLTPLVYVPGRQGSFSVEIRAAARRFGRLPYRVDPNLGSLMTVLASGYPVLIMQNLGIGFAPVWHFAVVIGFHRDDNEFILRTGNDERLTMDAVRFERRWRLADYWGIALLRPGDFPEWLQQAEFEAQLALLETAWAAVVPQLYEQMLNRWPTSTMTELGLGNIAYEGGQLENASRHYRNILSKDPTNLAALNNLAELKLAAKDIAAARELACAAANSAQGHPLEPYIEDLLARLAGLGAANCPPLP